MSEPYVHFQIKTNTAVMLIGNTQQKIFVFVSNSLGRVACHPRHPRPPVHASHHIYINSNRRAKQVADTRYKSQKRQIYIVSIKKTETDAQFASSPSRSTWHPQHHQQRHPGRTRDLYQLE